MILPIAVLLSLSIGLNSRKMSLALKRDSTANIADQTSEEHHTY